MKTMLKSYAFAAASVAAIISVSLTPAAARSSSDHPEILMQTTEGPITIDLYPKDAPITCANFIKLVKRHFYDGLMFHRVMDLEGPGEGHMAQGGDPNSRGASPDDAGNFGSGGTTPIKGEFPANGVPNPLKNVPGAVAMARTPDFNSASCQFYICTQAIPHLDGTYAVFGMVVKGLDNASKLVAGDKMTKVTIVHS